MPQNLPQWQVILSRADEVYYGGAAGGGKTDLAIGLAVEFHQKSLILRRKGTQLTGIIERSREIIGDKGRLNGNTGIWSGLPNGRRIELKGCLLETDKTNFQGRPNDLIVFDEAPEFLKSQVLFVGGWNRTSDPNQRVRILYPGNPPTSAEGRWIVKMFAPWLERGFKNPARPGELRWYAVIDGEETWVSGPEPIQHKDETITPKSRTFIPSKVEDNPYYMATGYKSRLQMLPEPLRSQMLKGDFHAGVSDNPWQVIPTAWIEAAQERWKSRTKPTTPLTSLGVDVARGGADQTVLCERYDTYFAELKKYPGGVTPDGPSVAALTIQAIGTARPMIGVDIIGVGASAYDFMRDKRVKNVEPINFAEGSDARDKSRQLAMRNKRAEGYWKLRESLDPASGDNLALPDDEELKADLCAPRWKITPGGILIESKEDIKKRLGRSTDCGDAIVLALMAKGRRQGIW